MKNSEESYPDHVQNLFNNLNQVDELINIHKTIAGDGKGRKSGVETLNKSCIVLITACWETFVEELASAAFDFLIKNAKTHTVIPFDVLTKASNSLKSDKDSRKVWDLAGEGWKRILINYKNEILSKEIDYFHVPRPENIDDLYEKLLGITKVTKYWKWKKKSNSSVIKTLNGFISLRGEIAHKLKSSRKVHKKDVLYYVNLIHSCGVILHNALSVHLINLTGKKAWDVYSYKSVS